MSDDDLFALDTLERDYLPVLERKCNIFNQMLEGKKILEVGCGTGNLLKLLTSTERELSGTDYSVEYLDKAKKKNPEMEFFQGDLTNINSWQHRKNSYDAVVCSEVLEHLKDESIALKIISSVLKPNGVLIVTVPALQILYSDLDKKIGHYRRYTIEEIVQIVSSAGFKVEKKRYWNFLGMFGWFLLFRVLKKSVKNTSSPILGTILGKWLGLESKIKFPLGQTIIIKARKQ